MVTLYGLREFRYLSYDTFKACAIHLNQGDKFEIVEVFLSEEGSNSGSLDNGIDVIIGV